MNYNEQQKFEAVAGTKSLSSLYPCNFQGKFHHEIPWFYWKAGKEWREICGAFERRHIDPGAQW